MGLSLLHPSSENWEDTFGNACSRISDRLAMWNPTVAHGALDQKALGPIIRTGASGRAVDKSYCKYHVEGRLSGHIYDKSDFHT